MKYSALTPELLAMSRELEELGGGDARIGRAAVCVMASGRSYHSILRRSADGVAVQDPRTCGASKGSKNFPLPNFQDTQNATVVEDTLGQASVNWLLDGFNATLLAFGQSGTGKSSTLFAEGDHAEQPLLHSMVQQIFAQRLPAGHGGQTYRIGFSYWEVLHHQVVDLLADPCQQTNLLQALHGSAAVDACQCVEASSAQEALSLLYAAQCNSSNWTSDQHGHMTPVPNNAHLFVRIVVYDAVKQQMSTLHVIDLAGNQRLSRYQSDCSSQKHQEQLAINQQLLSLSKLVSELSRLSTSGDSAAKQVTSARDGTLMQLVGPLLAGNARTFMLAAVSPDPDDYLDTVNTLRIATRALNIQTACMRTAGVRPELVHMMPAARVLSKATQPGMWDSDNSNRHQGAELQRSANRHDSGQRLAAASIHAQPKQRANPALRSTHNCAKQDRQWVPEQQQLHAGLPVVAAVTAMPSSGVVGHADAAHLETDPQWPSYNQPNANPASTATLEQSVSAQLPLHGSGGARAGLHAGHMGDDMCEPVELTWEGALLAASANGQATCDTGEALHACSSAIAPMRLDSDHVNTSTAVLSNGGKDGPLSAEPSFAFHCKPHLASASPRLPPPSRLQHPRQLSTLPMHSAAPDGPTSCKPEASLYQPYASFPNMQQPLTATTDDAAQDRQAAGSSGQQSSPDLQQPKAWRAAADHRQWDFPLPAADEAAGCRGAAEWEASVYTPQELADHLVKLKTEFRQIYSTILDGDTQPCCLEEAVATALPTTIKVSNSQQPGSPPSCSPPHEDPSMAASPPCAIPCCATKWPSLDLYTCMPLPGQQEQQLQPQQQSLYAMQQQCGSHGSQHSSSGQAAQTSTPQQHAKHADMMPHGYSDRGEDEISLPISLAAEHEHWGQSSASRAVSNRQQATGTHLVPERQPETGKAQQKELSQQQESCMQQDTKGTLGRGGTAAGEGMAIAQASSRPFLDGLRPCSPSERCSPEAAAQATHLLTAGQGVSGTKEQEVIDLQVNNEALLCMLERERQHSQRLAEALQQAEANSLESSLEQAVQLEEGRLSTVALRSRCRKLESESLFADMFEKYEEEIRQLQGEVHQLKQSNTSLSQRLALHEVEGPRSPHPRPPLKQLPIPSQTAASLPEDSHPAGVKLHEQTDKLQVEGHEASQEPLHTQLHKGESDLGQGELRLQALRKQLKRTAAQCVALKAEVAEGKRRDRTADLYKKKAKDGVWRVSELQKEVAHLKQNLHKHRLAAHQAADDLSQLQDSKEFLESEHVRVLAANQDLQASVETLREQVKLLRSQRQRAVVLAHLPALRPDAQACAHGKGPPQGCAALELARRLQLEPAQTPKMAAMIERMAEEVHLLLGDRHTFQQRESLLMDLLTGHSLEY